MELISKKKIAQAHKWLGRFTLIILIWFAVTAMALSLASYYQLKEAPLIHVPVHDKTTPHHLINGHLSTLNWSRLNALALSLSDKGFIDLPTDMKKIWSIRYNGEWAWLDPVLFQLEPQGNWVDSSVGFWTALHRGKLWGKGVNQVLVAITWLLMLAILLAFFLGLPKLRWPKKREHKVFYFHQVFGALLSPVLIICLVTGLVFAYAAEIKPKLPEFKLNPIENTYTVNEALSWLDKNHPSYRISRYYWSKGEIKLRFALKGDLHPKGNNLIYINNKGAFFQESQKQDASWRAYYQSWPLHSFNWLAKPINHYAVLIFSTLVLSLAWLILLRWRYKVSHLMYRH
ncbi:MAG: PepSY-associated TM helix domain-containing protein [Bermanella sp.]